MNDWNSFYKKISEIKFTMLVTHDEHGWMQARPFTTQAAGRDGAVWFFTRMDSEAVADVQRDAKILLCYADTDKNRFISSAGTASLSHDRQLINELWSPAYKAFFPQGLDDPELVLLRVEISRADIWDFEKSKMAQMLTIAKAAAGLKVDPHELGVHEVLKK